MDYKNADNKPAETSKNFSNQPISFGKDIAVMFTAKDKTCMDGLGVKLGDYAYMSDPTGDDKYADHANANHVYARLTGAEKPQMPLGGEKKWTAADNPEGQKNLKTFHEWMTVDPTYQP
jgi:hypothetical protein